ncbi:MAG TPA: rRNA pseudouridine synthase [Candidatus Avimonoglobus intestinipullorum]|uniref:Pseudouridine synthase n=1 Tax=Candidatus Avimonoglobus intestinipullorum TaxID=2840699 RepID=A0A9D1S688_9FIRM|nr:rRNA pseudouridine synthase [Candidatus Avimonoglobus intestinipullorum]
MVRLQKYIAMCGVASRRAAEELIQRGQVRVNGEVVRELGTKVEVGADAVEVAGKLIKAASKNYYIMLNKPVGYVSTVKDQFDRPTVIDLLQDEIKSRIFPVGRLDYDTQGLLLLTNDGDFTYKVTHPKFKVDKTYIATLKGGLTIRGLQMLRRGVVIDGYKTAPAEVEILSAEQGKTMVRITIHEGKNRQVRKMMEAVGSKVTALERISIGKVALGNLPLGRWRYLTSHEINYLKNL